MKNHHVSPFMGQLTISMIMFYGYFDKLPEGKWPFKWFNYGLFMVDIATIVSFPTKNGGYFVVLLAHP